MARTGEVPPLDRLNPSPVSFMMAANAGGLERPDPSAGMGLLPVSRDELPGKLLVGGPILTALSQRYGITTAVSEAPRLAA